MIKPFSIVIPVRDGKSRLGDCLTALNRQEGGGEFEAIIVDDGSRDPLGSAIGDGLAFPAKVIRQVGLGVSAARNRGIEEAAGRIIVFIDSDVVVQSQFLQRLAEEEEAHPEDYSFQPHLYGDRDDVVGRMEGLRLEATQRALKDEKGHVVYANTSAFAIRRSALEPGSDLFDPGAVRGEDTLLLTWLLRRYGPPRWVDSARAFHRPGLRLGRYIVKHFWIGYHTGPAREALRRERPEVLMGAEGRRGAFRQMWGEAAGRPYDVFAIGMMGLAHVLERCGRLADRCLGLKRGRHRVITMPVDCLREGELLARTLGNARRGVGMRITYLTAWTLVQGKQDPSMRRLFETFDLCYSDGMGVVLSSWLLTGRRLQKVTANNFIWPLFEQVSRHGISVALVGADEMGIKKATEYLETRFPGLNVVASSHGYLSDEETDSLRMELSVLQPRLLIVGMGQPLQEKWVSRMAEDLPRSVFLCVGGLFDYFNRVKPTPPMLIRNIGMEWFYILAHRPGRFWKRYLVGLPMLAWFILCEEMKRVLSLLSSKLPSSP